MGFWADLLPNLVANLVTICITALLASGFFLAVREWGKNIRHAVSKAFRNCGLKICFWLWVLTGKRSRGDYGEWASATRERDFVTTILDQASFSRAYALRGFADGVSTTGAGALLDRKSAIDFVMMASGSLSHEEIANPPSVRCGIESMQPSTRVDWLRSQPFLELSLWAIRLDEDDRIAWKDWLVSEEALDEFQKAVGRGIVKRINPQVSGRDIN